MRIGRPSHTTVVAYLALFAALGTGGAYAASQIGSEDIEKSAVLSKHIKKKAVETKHIRDGAVTEAKLAESTPGSCDPTTPASNLGVDVGGPATISNDQVRDWTFIYSKMGPCAAPGTTLTVTFAPRLTVVSATLDPRCSEAPVDTVTCQLATRGVIEVGRVAITARAPAVCSNPQTDSFVVSGVMNSSNQDPDPAGNTDSLTTAYNDLGC